MPLVPSVVTLGVKNTNVSQRRPETGRLLTAVSDTTCDTSVLSGSSTGDSPVTVTSVCVLCTVSVKSMVSDCPTCSTRSLRITFAKPCAAASTS